MRMWADAEISEHDTVLEIGSGTGYSTALACERLGSAAVTSVEIDSRRLDQAAAALHECGYTPTLAVADGKYGYWPNAPVDTIVAGCSFRVVPPQLIAQVRAGRQDSAHAERLDVRLRPRAAHRD
jgi:protein-L-isoaspartate O-methyltransferase